MTPYYQDDLVTIYHGDCREWMPEADVIVTDPPYGIGWSRGINNARRSKAHIGIVNDEDTSARDAVLATFRGPAIVFGSFYAPFPSGVRQVLVWHKPADSGLVGSITGYRRDAEPIFLVGPWPVRTVEWSSVLRTTAGQAFTAAETGHPHTKPVALMEWLVSRTTGIILDPFMGSGTTLVAAKSLGRKSIGIEIEERYCEIAAQRCSQEVLGLLG
jgi:site-specific DNA-methyltransferase (adenine-specific)